MRNLRIIYNRETACSSLTSSRFGDFVDHIYPIDLKIRNTTYIDRSVSYRNLILEIDSDRRLRTKLYDKRDVFNFLIVNFPCMCSNISAAHSYDITELVSYQDFLDRGSLLTGNLLNQGFLLSLGEVEVISSKVLRSPPLLGLQLWNICVKNDHRYVPLVVNTFLSFLHS